MKLWQTIRSIIVRWRIRRIIREHLTKMGLTTKREAARHLVAMLKHSQFHFLYKKNFKRWPGKETKDAARDVFKELKT